MTIAQVTCTACARGRVIVGAQVAADAPKVMWARDFQFESTIDGKAIKIASMLDEHTRVAAALAVADTGQAVRLAIAGEVPITSRVGALLTLRPLAAAESSSKIHR
jgi:hypothetical protein